MNPSVTVTPLTRAQDEDAAALAAAAFEHDPYWLALGPRNLGLRRHVITRLTYGQLVAGRRAGDCLLATGRPSHEVTGLARVARQEGDTSPRAMPVQICWCGPPGVARWWRVERGLARLRPAHSHDYLYTLAVSPAEQRRGLGRALLRRVIERAATGGVPLLLDTMTAENVSYYERFEFAVTGTLALPRGHTAWMMRWCG